MNKSVLFPQDILFWLKFFTEQEIQFRVKNILIFNELPLVIVAFPLLWVVSVWWESAVSKKSILNVDCCVVQVNRESCIYKKKTQSLSTTNRKMDLFSSWKQKKCEFSFQPYQCKAIFCIRWPTYVNNFHAHQKNITTSVGKLFCVT